MVDYKKLDSIPVLMDEYRNAVKDVVPGVGSPRSAKENPTTAFKVEGVKIKVSELAAYNAATGLRLRNELPITYPYVLSFPIVMKILTLSLIHI